MTKILDVTKSIFGFPASVQRYSANDLAQRAVNLTNLAKERANDPAAFDNNAPFFWPALISNNRVDAYYTRMAEDSLANYETDAKAGVSFQNSHNTDELALGRSLEAMLSRDPGGLVMPVEFGGGTDDLITVAADFYTIPALRLTGVSTDDFIMGVRTGLVKDVSIGFFNAHYVCSICGLDLFDWDCPHIPGLPYNTTDTNGNITGQRVAFAWVKKARLAEVSAVYRGATPGAAILKAEAEAESGRMVSNDRKTIETRYRMALPSKRQTVAVPGQSNERGNVMASEENRETPQGGQTGGQPTTPPAPAPTPSPAPAPSPTPAPDSGSGSGDRSAPAEGVFTNLRAALETAEQGSPEALRGFRDLATPEGIRTLVLLAADGRQYRLDLITTAKAEGVRAYGAEGFSEATYSPILERASITEIKQFIADWRKIGDNRLGGGRQTEPEAEGEESGDRSTQKTETPALAYT